MGEKKGAKWVNLNLFNFNHPKVWILAVYINRAPSLISAERQRPQERQTHPNTKKMLKKEGAEDPSSPLTGED